MLHVLFASQHLGDRLATSGVLAVFFDLRHFGDWLATSGARVGLIIAACLLGARLLWTIIHRVERAIERRAADLGLDRARRARTIGQALRSVAGGMFLFLGVSLTLREFGVDVGPIVAGAGVAGVAIGFGAQTLVRDLIAGVFILYEDHFDVGDTISGAGVAGIVETMSLRTTVLRDQDGRLHVIPNGEFKVITNLTRGWNMAVVDVGVAYPEDVERVLALLRSEMTALAAEPEVARDLIGPIEVVGVEDFRDLDYLVRVRARTHPLAHVAVRRAVRRRALAAFVREGVRMRTAPPAV
jgi:small conductance mechanosensitive channel